jgi:hypothetical protein
MSPPPLHPSGLLVQVCLLINIMYLTKTKTEGLAQIDSSLLRFQQHVSEKNQII